MKAVTRIRYAVNGIVQDGTHFLLSALLIATGFGLIGFTVLVLLASGYGRSSAEHVLSQGIGNTGVLMVSFGDSDFENDTQKAIEEQIGKIVRFRRAAKETDMIQAIGGMGRTQSGDVQMIVMDLELTNLCAFPIGKGILPEELPIHENTQYLYLGYAYRDIPVGSRYVVEAGEENITYEVAGIFQKNARFASDNMLRETDDTAFRNDISLNGEIVRINQGEGFNSPWFFSVREGYSVEDAMERLELLADEYGVVIEQYPLREKFDAIDAGNRVRKEILFEMTGFLTLVIVVTVTCFQLVKTYQNAYRYGIFYALGFSTSDIQGIILLQNGIAFLCALCLAFVMLALLWLIFFVKDVQAQEVFWQILLARALPIDGLAAVLLCVMVTYLPCHLLQMKEPIELIRGDV